MVGIVEVSAAYESIKAALGMAKGVASLKSEAEINAAVIAIQRTLLEAQAAAFGDYQRHIALQQKVAELEAALAKKDGWENEKARYKLTEFPTGRFAYVLKPNAANDQPSHRLCVRCFDENRKSVLQIVHRHSGGESVRCPQCNDKLTLSAFPPVENVSTGRRGAWLDGYT